MAEIDPIKLDELQAVRDEAQADYEQQRTSRLVGMVATGIGATWTVGNSIITAYEGVSAGNVIGISASAVIAAGGWALARHSDDKLPELQAQVDEAQTTVDEYLGVK